MLFESLLCGDVFIRVKDGSKVAEDARCAIILSNGQRVVIVFREPTLAMSVTSPSSKCSPSSSMLSCVSLRVELRSRSEVPGMTEPYEAGLKSRLGCTRPGGAADILSVPRVMEARDDDGDEGRGTRRN